MDEVERTSEIVAQEKLEKLTDPQFRGFAVRLMTIDEYKEFVKAGGGWTIKECVSYYFQDGEKAPTFNQWLEENQKNDWSSAIYKTDWPLSGRSLESYKELLSKLKASHNMAKEDLENEPIDKGIRTKVLAIFMKMVEENLGGYYQNKDMWRSHEKTEEMIGEHLTPAQSDQLFKLVASNTNLSNTELEKLVQPLLDEWKDWLFCKAEEVVILIREYLSEDRKFDVEKRVVFVEKMLENPKLIEEGDNLRDFLSALIFLEDDSAWRMWRRGERTRRNAFFQYQVALIIDVNETIDNNRDREEKLYEPFKYWRLLKKSFNNDPSLKFDFKKILGAVVLIPDRKIARKMADLSSKAGEVSHPVFSSKGFVTYPESK